MEILTEKPEQIPYDIIEDNITISEEDGNTVISDSEGNSLTLTFYDDGVVQVNKNFETNDLAEYFLLRAMMYNVLSDYNGRIESDFIKDSSKLSLGINIADNTILRDDKGVLHRDVNNDFKEFNDAILSFNKNLNFNHIRDNIIKYAPNLSLLIRTYNKLGFIPDIENASFYKDIIDYHNKSLKGRDKINAAYNFISIKAKDISKDIINQMLAQAAIDNKSDEIKRIVNNAPRESAMSKLSGTIRYVDKGSMFSKFVVQTLTLGGKYNVGIVASSMKNFEGISQYVYETLNSGTLEDLKDLLFNIKINGQTFNMIANSYARNINTVKSEDVKKALEAVDNSKDAFLDLSGLLTLATDNTKDPTLPKLNAGENLISLFDSGIMIGMEISDVAKLTLTSTGLLLNQLINGNIFSNDEGERNLTSAIKYLDRVPQTSFSKAQLIGIANVLARIGFDLGIKRNDKGVIINYSVNSLNDLIKEKSTRSTMLRVLKFLISPDPESKLMDITLEQFLRNKIQFLKSKDEYTKFSKYVQLKLNELRALDSLSEEDSAKLEKYEKYESEYNNIKNEINEIQSYIREGVSTNVDVNNYIREYNLLTNVDIESNLNSLKNNNWNHSGYNDNIRTLIEWIRNRNLIESDLIEGKDGEKHIVLFLINKLDKINQEMLALRPILALNQGLPNSVVDQISFYMSFGKIIQNRLEDFSLTRRANIEGLNEELEKLALFNSQAQRDPYFVDLHSFIYNSEYRKTVQNIYGKIKVITNIFKVIDNVKHYKAYLSLMDLLIQYGDIANVYRTSLQIEQKVLPDLLIYNAKRMELVRKNTIGTIYQQMNKKYLVEAGDKAIFKIPQFTIENGQLQKDSDLSKVTIRLGTSLENDLKFKDWILYIEFPKWLKKYKGNKALEYLGYRAYDFNPDHNTSINLAKTKRFNAKNPYDVVAFDAAKRDLLKLDPDIIKKLFYYNLLAYNGQEGQLSITSLFEDMIIEHKSDSITTDYQSYLASIEEDSLFDYNDPNTIEVLLLEIAPEVSYWEVSKKLLIPFIYVKDLNTGRKILYKKVSDIDGFYDENEEGDRMLDAFYVPAYKTYGKILEEDQDKYFDFNKNYFKEDNNYSLSEKEDWLKNVKIKVGNNSYSFGYLRKHYKITQSDIFITYKNKDGNTYGLRSFKEIKNNVESKVNNCK